jgi:hypothetical protein
MYLILSVFTCRPIPLLAIIKSCVFQEEYVCFRPTFYQQRKPQADVYHLIPSHPGLPERLQWHTLKQSCKAMAIKCILRLWMEEQPPMWRVAATILNKWSLTDKGWSSTLGVGHGANNSLL